VKTLPFYKLGCNYIFSVAVAHYKADAASLVTFIVRRCQKMELLVDDLKMRGFSHGFDVTTKTRLDF